MNKHIDPKDKKEGEDGENAGGETTGGEGTGGEATGAEGGADDTEKAAPASEEDGD